MKLKRKRFFVILTAFFLASGLFSCKDGDLTQGRRDSIGQIDDVVFVVSNQLWNSSLKDTLLYYFESPFLSPPLNF